MNSFLASIEGVSETLLIPLAARANAARFCPDLGFRDPFAEGLAYRWRLALRRFEDDLSSMRGCCLRAAWLDQQMRDFLQQHPDTLCISLGAGLDIAGGRVANGLVNTRFDWVDVDLPDVTALKARIIPPYVSRQLVSADLRRPGWTRQLPTPAGRSVLIRAEGLLMYLEKDNVAHIMQELAEWSASAPNVRIVFDWISPLGKTVSRWHPSVMKTSLAQQQRSPFSWGMGSQDEMSHLLGWKRHADYDLMAAIGGKAQWFNRLYRQWTGRSFCGCQALDRGAV